MVQAELTSCSNKYDVESQVVKANSFPKPMNHLFRAIYITIAALGICLFIIGSVVSISLYLFIIYHLS